MTKKYARYRMQVYAKPMLKDSACAFMNLGESIQYIAMDGIMRSIGLPEEDMPDVTANDVKNYVGDPLILPGKFILNDRPINNVIPFADDVYPIFISSVMLRNEAVAPALVEYLKKHEPIGCRDEQARTMLRELGIRAYLMGCFTMCLPRRRKEPENGKVFFVDTSENLEPFIPEELKKDAVRISHAIPVTATEITPEEDDRLNAIGAGLLKRYADEAKLVVTSRLHAAAPCLAMGIPVILASDNIDFRYGWLDKFIPIHTLDEYPSIDWAPAAVDVSYVRELIQEYLSRRIAGDPSAEEALQKLDAYYMARPKTDYYGYFRKRIAGAGKLCPDGRFNYILWGAGLHSGYAYDLIREMYPHATLKAVIDKYETGKRFGLDIIRGSDLHTADFDFAFITTQPGTPDATAKMEELFGADAARRYLIITSQQKS